MNFVLFLLLATAIVLIQCLIGGTRLAYALGPYAILGAAGLFSLCGLRKVIIKPSTLCVGSTLLLCAYVLGRAFFSPVPYLARTDICLSLACLVVYLLTAVHITQARFRTGLAMTLCLMATLQVFIGAIQFAEGESFMLYGFTRPFIYASQASGLFVNPNHLAAYLNAAGLFALSYAIWGRYSLTMKLFIGYLLLVCIGGVAISGSKPGYLCLFFGAMVFTAISIWVVRIYKEPQFPVALIGSVLALMAVIGTTLWLMKCSTVLTERLVQMSQVGKDLRKQHWMAAADQIQLAPVFGTGAGTHPIYQRLFRRAPVQTEAYDSHSDYLDILSEYGAVGGVLAAACLLIHLGAGFKNVKEIAASRLMNIFGPPRTNSMAIMLGALAAALTLLLQSLLDSNFHAPANALVLAFVFGILSNSGINRESEERRPGTAELGFRQALGIAGVALLALSTRWYHAEQISNKARRASEVRQNKEANILAAQAIAADPANPENYYYRGEALRNEALSTPEPQRRELLGQAIQAFEEGLKRFPENELLLVRLAETLDATGQFDKAEEAFVTAIANDPNLGIIYAYYAQHLRLSGDNYGAMECAETARKLIGRVRKVSDLEDPLPLLDVGAPALDKL